MSAFPGPTAHIYKNEAGEILGWDYPSEPEPYPDDDAYLDTRYDDDQYFYATCPHCHTEDQYHIDELSRENEVECHNCNTDFVPTDEELQA